MASTAAPPAVRARAGRPALNPIGAPLAHVGLHVSAVAHNYDTDLFLPPH